MLAYGLTQLKHNSVLFFDPKTELFVTIYVNDIKAYAPTDAIIDDLSAYVSKKYKLLT
ncbi:hypothetical protein MMC22_003922 [Lobaria immixta]|nr:hypothetical protein [Lobaria immixta]